MVDLLINIFFIIYVFKNKNIINLDPPSPHLVPNQPPSPRQLSDHQTKLRLGLSCTYMYKVSYCRTASVLSKVLTAPYRISWREVTNVVLYKLYIKLCRSLKKLTLQLWGAKKRCNRPWRTSTFKPFHSQMRSWLGIFTDKF